MKKSLSIFFIAIIIASIAYAVTKSDIEKAKIENWISTSTTGSLSADIVGEVTGNAATVTNGVYTTGDQSIAGTKTFTSSISGSIDGNAATVTNGVYTSRTVGTGSGLTGGGNLSLDRTLSVDSTVIRTTGDQSITGLKSFSDVYVSGTITNTTVNEPYLPIKTQICTISAVTTTPTFRQCNGAPSPYLIGWNCQPGAINQYCLITAIRQGLVTAPGLWFELSSNGASVNCTCRAFFIEP